MTETEQPPVAGRRRSVPVVAVVGLLALFAVLATGGLALSRGDLGDARERAAAAEARLARREEALAAARTFATALTSYDYARIAEDVARVTAGAAGKFADEYKVAGGARFQQLVKDNKAVSQGTVVSAGVVSDAGDKVVVLLAVDQTVTNANRPQPRVDRNRIQLTLERIDGRWLATDVQVL